MVIFYFEKDTKALRFVGWLRLVYVFGGMRVIGARSFTKFGTELGTEFLIAKLNTIWFGKGTEALRFIGWLRVVCVFGGMTMVLRECRLVLGGAILVSGVVCHADAGSIALEMLYCCML